MSDPEDIHRLQVCELPCPPVRPTCFAPDTAKSSVSMDSATPRVHLHVVRSSEPDLENPALRFIGYVNIPQLPSASRLGQFTIS